MKLVYFSKRKRKSQKMAKTKVVQKNVNRPCSEAKSYETRQDLVGSTKR